MKIVLIEYFLFITDHLDATCRQGLQTPAGSDVIGNPSVWLLWECTVCVCSCVPVCVPACVACVYVCVCPAATYLCYNNVHGVVKCCASVAGSVECVHQYE